MIRCGRYLAIILSLKIYPPTQVHWYWYRKNVDACHLELPHVGIHKGDPCSTLCPLVELLPVLGPGQLLTYGTRIIRIQDSLEEMLKPSRKDIYRERQDDVIGANGVS